MTRWLLVVELIVGFTGDSSFNIYDKDGNQLNGGLSVTDDTTTNATRYLIFGNGTSGSITPEVSSTKLTFNPSSGNLVVGGTVTANSDEKLKQILEIYQIR